MKINNETIDHVATLSKLSFKAEEKEEIRNDLERIIDFVDKLNEVDTQNIEPLLFVTESVNVLREDEAITTITKEEGLKNAPSKDSDYFKVPKVIDKN